MPWIYLRQLGFTYSTCRTFTETKRECKNLKKREIKDIFIKRNYIKTCFQLDMAYDDFKDLPRRTVSFKVLHNKAFNIAKNPNYDGYQQRLASMADKLFDKKSLDGGIKDEIISNLRPLDLATRELAEELHKLTIRKFEKRKVAWFFKDNVWDSFLKDMQLISRYNKEFGILVAFKWHW